jgi:hypothetical protein
LLGVFAVADALLIAAVVLAMAIRSSTPGLDPDREDRVTLYSIDFREEEKRSPGTGEVVHGYTVLGKVEVTDPGQRRQLIGALKESLAERDVMQSKCFFPRHVLRVEQDGRTIDYVICFQCHYYELYVNGSRRNHRLLSIGGDAAPVFNKPLEVAGGPIVPKEW